MATIGMVGLGRMGSNMALRLLRGGHRCHVFDLSERSVVEMAGQGATGHRSLEELVRALPRPRLLWMMVPAGEATEQTVQKLAPLLESKDILVDGGNSWFKDDVRRAGALRPRGIEYMDVGTSGGIWGLDRGYCMMAGGSRSSFEALEPILRTLAPGELGIPSAGGPKSTAPQGYLHCGPVGSGHFVKMVHNGIEYGMMQALAEGFDILRNADSEALPEELRYSLELGPIAEVWRRGSVVSSWLLDLIARALAEDPALKGFIGSVQDSGEGRWTVQAAVEEAVPADVITASLYARFRSRQGHTFGDKLLSAMRKQFGGHAEAPMTKSLPSSAR